MPARDTNKAEGADEAANDRENSQDDQLDGHDRWSFKNASVTCPPGRIAGSGPTINRGPTDRVTGGRKVRPYGFFFFLVAMSMVHRPSTTIVSREGAEDEAEHVEGGQSCRDDTEPPQGIS